MSQITAISPQKRGKTRFNVSIDGKFAVAVSAETLFREHLKVGKIVTPIEVDRLKFGNETGLLLNQTLRLLSRRPRSSKEIHQYLHKKHATDRQKEFIIQKLERANYINDEEFVKWWLNQRQTFRPKGNIALYQELRQKGVDEKLIKNILDQKGEGSETSQHSLALTLAQKRLQRLHGLSQLEAKQKLSRFLAGRGFDWETVKDVIDSLVKKD